MDPVIIVHPPILPNLTFSGSLGLPGGHLEFGESFATCAARELLEETGIEVKEGEVHFLTAGNNVFEKERKHYVTIAMGVSLRSARTYLEPKVSLALTNATQYWNLEGR